MELKLEHGDYVPDERGGLQALSGAEALLQRVLFRLCAKRGQFPFLPQMGSRLYQLGRERPSARQTMAAQYAAEALADEPGLNVLQATLKPGPGGVEQLTLALEWQGSPLSVSLDLMD